jgi:Derlin-2/3
MAPRDPSTIHNTGASVQDFFRSLPFVCRTLLSTYLLTGLLLLFGLLPLEYVYHAWGYVFTLGSVPQLHRLILNFAVVGRPSINYLFNLVWLVQYGASYEKSAFLGDAPSAVWMALVGMMNIMVLDLVVPPLSAPFHGQALVFMLLYLWSKSQGEGTTVSFFGVIKLKAQYLPFALLFIDVVQGADPFHGVRGILAGHAYWFMREVLRTPWVTRVPGWLQRNRWLNGMGGSGSGSGVTMRYSSRDARGGDGAGRTAAPSTSSAGFRAFSGKGHKLS